MYVLALFALYPDIIAHGRLVTTDIAAAFGYIITMYYFDKALTQKTFKYIVYAAIAFGVAQLLKFSAFLLFGALLFLVFIRAYIERHDGFSKQLWQYLKAYFLVCILSIIVVWIAYIPFVWNTPTGIEHEVIDRNITMEPSREWIRNGLHVLENNVVTRALGHYLLGVALVIYRVEGGNATFLMGQIAEKSIQWFFPIAWFYKTPLTIIALLSMAFGVIAIKRFGSRSEASRVWALLIPFAIYWAFTLKGSLNIGIRHLIPTIPFVLMLIGYAIYRINMKPWKWGVLLLLLGFQIYHTLSYYPGFIGYFNNLVPRDERHNYLVDSSLDWGQDLLRLKQYIEANDIKEIKIDYFGGSVPSYYIPQSTPWHSQYGPTTGWLAISATFYQSSKLYGPKEGKWSYQWLDDHEPKAIIGGSILVFNISEEDLERRPPVSPYPITFIDSPAKTQEEKERKIEL
ncbi:MAG: hypothetical protein BWY68_00213 [bacterium ADurb.Bin400]|nr:MAG: hypothetical protein BWY68_00213 [bacterium ADurb.Bin400]